MLCIVISHLLGVLPNVTDDEDDDTADILNTKYGINFMHYCEDETIATLRDIDQQELNACIQRMERYLLYVQPKVVVYVGVQIIRMHDKVHTPQWGYYKDMEWENTGRITRCYVLPNTRKANKRDKVVAIRRFVLGSIRSLYS
jgi:hypothetical protein